MNELNDEIAQRTANIPKCKAETEKRKKKKEQKYFVVIVFNIELRAQRFATDIRLCVTL